MRKTGNSGKKIRILIVTVLKDSCYDRKSASLPNSYVEILTPYVMVVGEAFGRQLGHEGRDFISRISAFIRREMKVSTSFFCHVRIQ